MIDVEFEMDITNNLVRRGITIEQLNNFCIEKEIDVEIRKGRVIIPLMRLKK